ncbi:MAG: isoprenylcysteine carboxylmethyltransferase family protein [Thermodesulfobacteriota bacterium]|jgi:protein-S-isoprenylcysteine O-methyltransferase
MNLPSIITTIFIVCWLGFEDWLIIRDRVQGRGKTEKDKGSLYFCLLGIVLGVTLAWIVNGKERFFFPGGRTTAVFIIGFTIMILGFALRLWAITVLGKSFRITVETHEGQKVVRNGPYRLLRHPAYSGMMLICIGYGTVVQNWLSLLFVIGLPLPAYLYRIYVEEATLRVSFGSDYDEYCTHTKRLIPWIW